MHFIKTTMNVCLEDGGLFCQLSIVCQVIVLTHNLINSEVDGTFLDTICIDLYHEGLVFYDG